MFICSVQFRVQSVCLCTLSEGLWVRKRIDDSFGKENQGHLKVVYIALGLTSMECMSRLEQMMFISF